MKNNFKLLCIAAVVAIFSSCSSTPNYSSGYSNNQVQQTPNVQAQSNQPNFDVVNFANLVKTTQNTQVLEQNINSAGNNINNMDLDGDGNVDYLTVSENNQSIQVLDNNTVIATLSVTGNTNNAYVSIQGNQQYCGPNYSYSSSLANALLVGYLFSHHAYYHSPYHRGYYPTYYSPTRHIVRTRTITRTTPNSNRSFNSGTANRNVAPVNNTPVRKSIGNPQASQRSFQARNNSTPVKATGFGSGSSSNSRPSSGFSSGSSSSSRSSSFGSSHSSGFGGSRSSSFGRRK